jgi:hypothetical protein
MNNEQVLIYTKGFNDGLAKGMDTNPVQTLTDEEINAEMLAYLNSKTMGLEDFAKAILRKAQQK